MSRALCFAAVAALGVVIAGCGSNNTGKIVGKWKADALDLGPIGPKGLADIVWDFRDDGSFTVSRVPIGPGSPAGEVRVTGRYTLEVGDRVAFTHLDPPEGGKNRAFELVRIDGDTMTMGGGKDRPVRLTRLPPQ